MVTLALHPSHSISPPPPINITTAEILPARKAMARRHHMSRLDSEQGREFRGVRGGWTGLSTDWGHRSRVAGTEASWRDREGARHRAQLALVLDDAHLVRQWHDGEHRARAAFGEACGGVMMYWNASDSDARIQPMWRLRKRRGMLLSRVPCQGARLNSTASGAPVCLLYTRVTSCFSF